MNTTAAICAAECWNQFVSTTEGHPPYDSIGIGSASVGTSLIVTGGSIAILAHYYLCRTQAQQPPQSLRRYAIKTATLFTFGAAKVTLGILQILNATHDSNFPDTIPNSWEACKQLCKF